ncbi:MAG: hypothetical protein ACYCT1_05045 [Steroidobacteraceae bacterium]
MATNLTLGATWRRLVDLGYAATSAACPDRLNETHTRRQSFIALAGDPAAVFCRPTAALGCELEDAEARQLVLLVLTGYLLADAKQAKAVNAVLEEYKLLGGPVCTDSFGNQTRPLRYDGAPIFDGEATARLAFDDDDSTVLIQHAIAPDRFTSATDQWGNPRRVAASPVGSHLVELDGGEWKGSLLETPRERLPELLPGDVNKLISDVERARWSARPGAREAA